MLVELDIVPSDRDHGGRHRLVDVARGHRRTQPLFRRARAQEDDPHRLLVRRRGAHLGEVERLAQQRIGDRAVKERAVGAGLGEELGQRLASEGRMASYASWLD